MRKLIISLGMLASLILSACSSNLHSTPVNQVNSQTENVVDAPQAAQQPIGPPSSTKSSSGAQYVF